MDYCSFKLQVNPGYGGPKYIDAALKKIRQLKDLQPDLFISVDGGVNEQNASQLIAAGANVLVAGGGVFKADDKKAAIDALKSCGVVVGNVPHGGMTAAFRP